MTASYATGAGACITIPADRASSPPAEAPTRGPVTRSEAPAQIRARLIARRDALPVGNHRRAAISAEIARLTHAMLRGRE